MQTMTNESKQQIKVGDVVHCPGVRGGEMFVGRVAKVYKTCLRVVPLGKTYECRVRLGRVSIL